MSAPGRLENATFFLPFFGLVVIVPPIVNVFSVERMIFGIPLFAIYIFVVWVSLIVLTMLISRRINPDKDADEPPANNKKTP